MEITQYITIMEEAEGEITEKKSRFICNIFHIEDDSQISNHVETLRKKHYQAKHVCYAAILGEGGEIKKYSDDGEPSGTAGRPMLEMLAGRELTNVLVCVTRYFGGVLLGTGGLLRAYTDALSAALDNASVVTCRLSRNISCVVDYRTLGKIKYKLDSYEAAVVSEEYSDKVSLLINLPDSYTDSFIEFVTDLTGGKTVCTKLGIDWNCMRGNKQA